MPKGDWVSLHPFKTVVSGHQANNKRHTIYAVNVLKSKILKIVKKNFNIKLLFCNSNYVKKYNLST